VVAGTPTKWKFDADARTFTFAYSTKRASGKSRFKRGRTDVFVPKLQYAKGYRAIVKGARVISKRNARHLRLRAKKGAKEVRLTLTRSAPMRAAR
jgi:hypothetical protein